MKEYWKFFSFKTKSWGIMKVFSLVWRVEAWFDAVALADRDFEGGILHTKYVYRKLWVEIESPCLIGMCGCCGKLVLLDSSGASVNDEAGIGSYYIVEEGY